jgi:hypothetical protein
VNYKWTFSKFPIKANINEMQGEKLVEGLKASTVSVQGVRDETVETVRSELCTHYN